MNTVTFDAPAGQVAQKPPNPFTVGLGQQQQMGEALFGQPGTVLGIPPQQQFRGFGSQQTQQQEGFVSGQQVAPNQQMQWRAQQQQPGMMGGVQQMPTHQVWGGQSQAGSQWGAGGQFGGAQHAQQFGGFPGAQQPQQQLSRFASGSQQQPQQLGGLGSGGGGWDPANEGGGLQQHPAQQGFMGGPPQQPPSPAGGAPNPFAVSHATFSIAPYCIIIMFIYFHSLAPLKRRTLFYDAVQYIATVRGHNTEPSYML